MGGPRNHCGGGGRKEPAAPRVANSRDYKSKLALRDEDNPEKKKLRDKQRREEAERRRQGLEPKFNETSLATLSYSERKEAEKRILECEKSGKGKKGAPSTSTLIPQPEAPSKFAALMAAPSRAVPSSVATGSGGRERVTPNGMCPSKDPSLMCAANLAWGPSKPMRDRIHSSAETATASQNHWSHGSRDTGWSTHDWNTNGWSQEWCSPSLPSTASATASQAVAGPQATASHFMPQPTMPQPAISQATRSQEPPAAVGFRFQKNDRIRIRIQVPELVIEIPSDDGSDELLRSGDEGTVVALLVVDNEESYDVSWDVWCGDLGIVAWHEIEAAPLTMSSPETSLTAAQNPIIVKQPPVAAPSTSALQHQPLGSSPFRPPPAALQTDVFNATPDPPPSAPNNNPTAGPFVVVQAHGAWPPGIAVHSRGASFGRSIQPPPPPKRPPPMRTSASRPTGSSTVAIAPQEEAARPVPSIVDEGSAREPVPVAAQAHAPPPEGSRPRPPKPEAERPRLPAPEAVRPPPSTLEVLPPPPPAPEAARQHAPAPEAVRQFPPAPKAKRPPPPAPEATRPRPPGLEAERPSPPGLEAERPSSPVAEAVRPYPPPPKAKRPPPPAPEAARPRSPAPEAVRPPPPTPKAKRPPSPAPEAARPRPPGLEAERPSPPVAGAARPSPPGLEDVIRSPPAAEAVRPYPPPPSGRPPLPPPSREPVSAPLAVSPSMSQHATIASKIPDDKKDMYRVHEPAERRPSRGPEAPHQAERQSSPHHVALYYEHAQAKDSMYHVHAPATRRAEAAAAPAGCAPRRANTSADWTTPEIRPTTWTASDKEEAARLRRLNRF